MKKLRCLIGAFATVALFGLLLFPGLPVHTHAQHPAQELVSIPRVFVASPVGSYELHRINRENGKTISTLELHIPEFEGCEFFRTANGLAADPLTGQLYTTLSCGTFDSITPRFLAIINTFNGVMSVIGNTGHFISGLAFTPDGTLIGVTGNGAFVPNTLFRINTDDASTTAICQLPHNTGNFQGQAIAIDPTTGILYHSSGNPREGGTQRFESVADLTPTDPLEDCSRTAIPLSPPNPFVQPGAMTFGDSFLLADVTASGFGRLFHLSQTGEATRLGVMDHISKGLAFVSAPAKICYEVMRAEGRLGQKDVVIKDLIVGDRPARFSLNRPFVVCVPGGVRFMNSDS